MANAAPDQPGMPPTGQTWTPVFVDATGRRSRVLGLVGGVIALGCSVYVAVLGVSIAGGSAGPGTRAVFAQAEPSASPQPVVQHRPAIASRPVVRMTRTPSPVASSHRTRRQRQDWQ